MNKLTIPKGLSPEALAEVTRLTNRFNQLEEEKEEINRILEAQESII